MALHLTIVHAVSGLFATGPAAAAAAAAFFPPQVSVHQSVQRAAAACLRSFKLYHSDLLFLPDPRNLAPKQIFSDFMRNQIPFCLQPFH